MAEASIEVFNIVIIIAAYFGILLYFLRYRRKLSEFVGPRPQPEFLLPYSQSERAHFMSGVIFGSPLVIFSNVHLIFGESNLMPPFLLLIQLTAIAFSASLLITSVIFVRVITILNFRLKKKNVRFLEGSVWPSAVAGIVYFLSNPATVNDIAKICCKWA